MCGGAQARAQHRGPVTAGSLAVHLRVSTWCQYAFSTVQALCQYSVSMV
jgi:hypothetical protein